MLLVCEIPSPRNPTREGSGEDINIRTCLAAVLTSLHFGSQREEEAEAEVLEEAIAARSQDQDSEVFHVNKTLAIAKLLY